MLLIIFIISFAILLYKIFNITKIISITFIISIIGIIIFLLNNSNEINLLYTNYFNMPIISQEKIDTAIAVIDFSSILNNDNASSKTYYIFKRNNNTYYYLKTIKNITIAREETTIIKKENLTNKKQLKIIINDLELKKNLSSTLNKNETQTILYYYKNKNIEKSELLNKLF